MIGNQAAFPAPEAVSAFQRDTETVGLVCDEHGWYITHEWATKFQAHLDALQPFASEGFVAAQYSIAVIYMLGYIYASESEFTSHQETDAEKIHFWLEKAAASGHLGAIDNLLAIGTSAEAMRLRNLVRDSLDFEAAPAPLKGSEINMRKLFQRAYGTDS